MRLPTRGGQVVSAISEIRRLAPRKKPESDQLRAEALKLYRTIVRTLYRAPPSQSRTESWAHARNEFERRRQERDLERIEYYISDGRAEYKMFAHYFEEQRHFVKPLVKREYPEKRVEMLKSLLKITPVEKRARIRFLLGQAEEKVVRVRLRKLGERVDKRLGNKEDQALEGEVKALLGELGQRAGKQATSSLSLVGNGG